MSIISSSYSRPATSSGFTLIELMVTIAVLGIIASFAAPNISAQLANQRVKSTTANLNNALKEAKVESVIRRQNITVTYDSSAKTITLTDSNNNAISSFNIDSKSSVDQAITPTTVNSVVFQPSKVMAGGAIVVYTICDSNDVASPRQVVVSSVANISIQLGGTCP